MNAGSKQLEMEVIFAHLCTMTHFEFVLKKNTMRKLISEQFRGKVYDWV